jgi:hypothetical protein
VSAAGRRALVALALALLAAAPALASADPAEVGAAPDIVLWGHPGCPHCRAAHAWLAELRVRRPELVVVEHDVSRDADALAELHRQSAAAGRRIVAFPTWRVRGELLVGFGSGETTGRAIEALLAARAPPRAGEAAIELPWLGRVSVDGVGLPLFTLAVGLVDGFNPCAMWVLLFLLALLVNLKDRARMLAVAGSFVLVSGLAYFAFMAAWLNVFLLVGFSRAVQVLLGGIALLVGAVHLKDAVAPGAGPSLAIPESAKPGIYARVRAIVRAESLPAALLGATALAVLVNAVELLCTAGLPALYTQVLAQQGVGPGARYAYLALYIAAYMLDDSIMVGIAVVTLGRRKLQERAGRGLQLLSGTAIAVLGLLLLFAPQALVW